ncbi:hypothetical protein SF1_23800 [Sphingobacterium faecium NBRC 15299]|nr:hypothetical protein SF1_23800 [Sphingobacterium faecium NBRC 15299]
MSKRDNIKNLKRTTYFIRIISRVIVKVNYLYNAQHIFNQNHYLYGKIRFVRFGIKYFPAFNRFKDIVI